MQVTSVLLKKTSDFHIKVDGRVVPVGLLIEKHEGGVTKVRVDSHSLGCVAKERLDAFIDKLEKEAIKLVGEASCINVSRFEAEFEEREPCVWVTLLPDAN